MEAEDSQDSSSSLKRPRCPNWTEQDKVVLVRNIQLRRDIIMSKNKGENALREAAWQEILAAVNEEAHFPRTLEQVKKQYENLKMRARQVYNDIVQCKGAVKPHILSPATELMIDLFKQETNMSTGTSSMMLFDDCSISTPGFTQFTKKKSTTPQPILPKPPPTATIITTATPTSLSKTPVSTTSSYEESPDWNTNGGSGTYFSDKDFRHSQHILDSDQTGYTTSAKRLKSTDTRLESNLIQQFEIERIQAETQRHKAETELIYQRRECEFAIFEMKSKVLQAKLEYYRSNKMIKPKIEVTSDDDNDTT